MIAPIKTPAAKSQKIAPCLYSCRMHWWINAKETTAPIPMAAPHWLRLRNGPKPSVLTHHDGWYPVLTPKMAKSVIASRPPAYILASVPRL